MTPKLLLRWMFDPADRRASSILTVYRIERNRYGVLVYRIVERIDDDGACRARLIDKGRWTHGIFCAHNRPADVYDMRRAAGFGPGTPDAVVIDWWTEHVPVTDEQWRRAERRKAKGAQ